MSAPSTFIEDGTQLFHNKELGSAVLNVLFTMYDIDEIIDAARSTSPPQSSPTSTMPLSSPGPSFHGPSSSLYSSSSSPLSMASTAFKGPIPMTRGRSTTEEEVIQEQAHRFQTVLDVVLNDFTPVVWVIGANRIFDPNLVYLLAVGTWEQAAFDDHLVAFAVQDGRELPAITRCQSLVQNDRLYRVVKHGIAELGDQGGHGAGIRNRVQRVVAAFVRQADIDFNREIFAWRSKQTALEVTQCQKLMEHPFFITLFSDEKQAYYVELRARQLSKLETVLPKPMMKTVNRIDCTGCCAEYLEGGCLEAPCGHFFCPACVTTLVGTCIKDEACFPPQCCKRAIEPNEVVRYLEPKLRSIFAAACFEFGTPPPERIYCPFSGCSSFIGSRGVASTIQCRSCGIPVCTRCKERAHPEDNCEQNKLMEKVRELAEKEKWKECPRCHSIIDKLNGCNHMVCRCGQQFCYRCGTPLDHAIQFTQFRSHR